jgi:transposase
VRVATKPLDFRKGAEGLAALSAKRLEDGEFRWPKVQDGVMRLTAAQLGALLEGLDWRRVHEARRTRAPVEIA